MSNQHSKCDDCYKSHLPEVHDRAILPSEAFSEGYVPEFNQASEDELRAEILTEFKQVHKLAPADYTENCTNVVMSIIRTEKLKLLDEVRTEDAVRLSKLNRILKRYNVLGYVTAYNEAIKRDWQDIRLPVVRDLTLYEPAELSQTLNKLEAEL